MAASNALAPLWSMVSTPSVRTRTHRADVPAPERQTPPLEQASACRRAYERAVTASERRTTIDTLTEVVLDHPSRPALLTLRAMATDHARRGMAEAEGDPHVLVAAMQALAGHLGEPDSAIEFLRTVPGANRKLAQQAVNRSRSQDRLGMIKLQVELRQAADGSSQRVRTRALERARELLGARLNLGHGDLEQALALLRQLRALG